MVKNDNKMKLTNSEIADILKESASGVGIDVFIKIAGSGTTYLSWDGCQRLRISTHIHGANVPTLLTKKDARFVRKQISYAIYCILNNEDIIFFRHPYEYCFMSFEKEFLNTTK